MNNNLKEIQKKEAIKRLQNLTNKFNLKTMILEDFKKGIIDISTNDSTFPIYLFERIEKIIDKLEKESDIIIYHIITSKIDSCLFAKILYVSNNPKKWRFERLKDDNYQRCKYHCLTHDKSSYDADIVLVGVNGVLMDYGDFHYINEIGY